MEAQAGRSGSSAGQTPASSSTNVPPSSPPPSNPRGAVASVACEACRRKKVKCDQGEPKCSNCTKSKVACEYRETMPTKKDKGLEKIFQILERMEHQQLEQTDILSTLKSGQRSDSGIGGSIATQESSSLPPPERPTRKVKTRQSSASTTRAESRPQHLPSSGGVSQPYRHASAAHKMLTWPAIQKLLTNTGADNHADLQSLDMEGSAFIIRMCKEMPRLPLDEILSPQEPFRGMQSQYNRQTGGGRVVFDYLTYERMDQLAKSYFDTFNMLYPFMDREQFTSETINTVKSQGFARDALSVIALLVFALGEVAEDSLQNPAAQEGEESSEHYPGIELFNEARKRVGFLLTYCDLENVHIFSLTALYYESCSCHVDFWRMTATSSSACQILVTCKPIVWNSPEGDLVKRAYWHCAILETGLHLELDLPLTGLLKLPDPPSGVFFEHERSEADDLAQETSNYRAHYTAQLTLRRLCAQVHDDINESMGTARETGETSEGFGGPTADTLKNLIGRLQFWREKLPDTLQWPEDDPTVYPAEVHDSLKFQRNLDPELTPKMFTTQPQDDHHVPFPYVYDIQVALLRTRYYYAKYMVYRPYVYKALHFPDELTPHDAEAVAICLKACLKWPLTMSPTARRKRLIPYLFCWSQNLLGIILILNLSEQNPVLWKIREQYCGGIGSKFHNDVNESIGLMLDWIYDLKTLCPIARWCCNVLKPFYGMSGTVDSEMVL